MTTTKDSRLTTPANEAAERLRGWLLDWDEEAAALLTQALAAERRATVERIRQRVMPLFGISDQRMLRPILDEEAARG